MAHISSCPSLAFIFTYINPHIISFTSPILHLGAQDNIFTSHIMSPQIKVTEFSSLAPTDDSRRTLSLYIMLFYRRRYTGRQLSVASLPTGICILHIMGTGRRAAVPSVFDLGHRRRALHLPPAEQSGHECACPTTFHVFIDLHSTIREQQVQTSNIISTDKYNPVRVTHQIHVNTSNATLPPPPAPSTNVL